MKPVTPRKLVKSAIALAIVNACISQPVFAQDSTNKADEGKIEKIIVTANRHAQDLQKARNVPANEQMVGPTGYKRNLTRPLRRTGKFSVRTNEHGQRRTRSRKGSEYYIADE